MRYAQLNPYELKHLPTHCSLAGYPDAVERLLLDLEWLQTKLASLGPSALLSDFSLLAGSEPFDTLAATIGLSEHILRSDPEQLISQLLGRLRTGTYDGDHGGPLQTLLSAARARRERPRMLPVHATLLTGKDLIARTIVAPTDSDGFGSAHVSVVAPDDMLVVTGTHRDIVVWDMVSTGVKARFAVEHRVDKIEFAGSEKYALTQEVGAVFRLLNLVTMEQVWAFRAVNDYPISPIPQRGQIIGVNLGTKSLWVSDLLTMKGTRPLLGSFSEGVQGVAFSPTGRWLIVLTSESVRSDSPTVASCFDLDTEKVAWRIGGLPPHGIRSASFSHDGSQIVITGSKYTSVLDAVVGNVLAEWPHEHLHPCMALHPTGKYLTLGGHFAPLQLFELMSGRLVTSFGGERCYTSALKISNNGHWLYQSDYNDRRSVRVWNLTAAITGDALPSANQPSAGMAKPDSPETHESCPVIALWRDEPRPDVNPLLHEYRVLAVSANAQLVFTCEEFSYDFRVWDNSSGIALKSRTDYQGQCDGPAFFSSDGDSVLYLIHDMKNGYLPPMLVRWNFLNDQVTVISSSHDNQGLSYVACTPDLSIAVIGGPDNIVSACHTDKKSILWSHDSHCAGVTAVTITQSGKWAVSGSKDGGVKLWDVETGMVVDTFFSDSTVNQCSLSECGEFVRVKDDFGRSHVLSVCSATSRGLQFERPARQRNAS